ncbi:MAG: DeoR/GlpR transcriptional regulator [Chloroflexi bacterium]|nr:DeoR/GlpR transcriptional regulator [Chloroflexota bacterium]
MSEQPLPTLTVERHAAIIKMVMQDGAVRAADLVTRFGVNAATIRRDMKALEEQGALRRVHGGAIAVKQIAPEISGASKDPMVRIGQTVAEMVVDGETVFLGPGPLSLEVARCLVERSRLAIVTNSLKVAHWVAGNTSHTLIVTGGQVDGRDRDMGLVGKLTRAALSSLRADHVVLELGGVSAVEGLTDDSLPQAEIAQVLLETGSQVVILVPVERVGRVAAAYIAPISEADVVVTAREAPSAYLWDLSESGVRVILA